MNQHYFDIPFAFAGDVTAIPDPLQVGGTVSMTEGWNNNYQRNLSTDPAALPIDRSTTNWLLLQISTALQALQQAAVPEFILSSQNGGTAYSYGQGAVVLWSATGNAPFGKYVSLTAGNTNTPSAGDPQGLTTGWQIEVDPIATAAQASAGTNDASIMTPLKVAQQTALRALLAGSSSQVFNVGPAVSATQATQAQQIQQQGVTYAADTGAANAYVVTLSPAPAAYVAPLVVSFHAANTNTGASTINVNGLGVKNIFGAGGALTGGEIIAGGIYTLVYDGTQFRIVAQSAGAEQVGAGIAANHAVTLGQNSGRFLNVQVFTASGTYTPTPGTTKIIVEAVGGGAGGGGASATSSNASVGGGGGGAPGVRVLVTSVPASVAVTIGAGGAGASGGTGGNGGTTTFGSFLSVGGALSAGATAASSTVPLTSAPGTGGISYTIAGATLLNFFPGAAGTWGIVWSVGGSALGGTGGASMFGSGAVPVGTGSAGASALGAGAGGGGACNASTGVVLAGGNGGNGKVIVYEYGTAATVA